jgi:ATP-dependent exoDNAse (exonuclease V) beta subunit
MLEQANRLLRGKDTDEPAASEEPDEHPAHDDLRDRLLAGYQSELVDEYQDIDAAQYE